MKVNCYHGEVSGRTEGQHGQLFSISSDLNLLKIEPENTSYLGIGKLIDMFRIHMYSPI